MSESPRACKHPDCNNPLNSKKKEFCRKECKNDYHRLARIKGEKAMHSKGIRAALLENSERLQKVAKFLGDGNPHSTREIIRVCDVCAVNSIVDELRHPKNGFAINCKQTGKECWEYTMIGGFENLKRIREVS